jgi:hypothetical protein
MTVLIKFSDTNIGKETRLWCKYDLSNFPQYSVPIERIEAIFSLSKSKKNIQKLESNFLSDYAGPLQCTRFKDNH